MHRRITLKFVSHSMERSKMSRCLIQFMIFAFIAFVALSETSSEKEDKEKEEIFKERLKEDKDKLFKENEFFRKKLKNLVKSNEDKLNKLKDLETNNTQLSNVMDIAKKKWEKRFHSMKEEEEDLMYQAEHAQREKSGLKYEMKTYMIGTTVVIAAILMLNFMACKAFGYKVRCCKMCRKSQSNTRQPNANEVSQLL